MARRAHAKLSILDIVQEHLHRAPSVLKGLSSSEKGLIFPIGTTINPLKTEETAANGNLRLCLKVETTNKVSLELTSKINLGWQGVLAKLSILDIVQEHLHSLERINLTEDNIMANYK